MHPSRVPLLLSAAYPISERVFVRVGWIAGAQENGPCMEITDGVRFKRITYVQWRGMKSLGLILDDYCEPNDEKDIGPEIRSSFALTEQEWYKWRSLTLLLTDLFLEIYYRKKKIYSCYRDIMRDAGEIGLENVVKVDNGDFRSDTFKRLTTEIKILCPHLVDAHKSLPDWTDAGVLKKRNGCRYSPLLAREEFLLIRTPPPVEEIPLLLPAAYDLSENELVRVGWISAREHGTCVELSHGEKPFRLNYREWCALKDIGEYNPDTKLSSTFSLTFEKNCAVLQKEGSCVSLDVGQWQQLKIISPLITHWFEELRLYSKNMHRFYCEWMRISTRLGFRQMNSTVRALFYGLKDDTRLRLEVLALCAHRAPEKSYEWITDSEDYNSSSDDEDDSMSSDDDSLSTDSECEYKYCKNSPDYILWKAVSYPPNSEIPSLDYIE